MAKKYVLNNDQMNGCISKWKICIYILLGCRHKIPFCFWKGLYTGQFGDIPAGEGTLA